MELMKKKYWVCVIFTLFCMNLIADSLPNITSIKAEFMQEIYGDSADNGSIKYSGILMARADSKAYWKYELPMKKEIFVDKNRVLIYEPEFEQVIVSDKIDIDFVAILNAVQKKSDLRWESVINNQTFDITLKNGKPHKILYKDELDNKVIITLKNVVLNGGIGDEIFNPKISSNVEVIYQ